MNTAQRIIKYFTIAFAVLIIGGIISAMITGVMLLSYIFDDRDDGEIVPGTAEVIEIGDITGEKITGLHIDVKATSVTLELGEKLAVIADDETVAVSQNGNALYVREKEVHFWSGWSWNDKEIRVVLPRDEGELEMLRVNNGAGRVMISGLVARNLELDLGAGRAELNQVKAIERAKINGGAGHLAVRESELHDLDLDMGVGKVELGAKLTGNNRIDAGIGKLELDFSGKLDEYKIKVEKGLGSIELNGEKLSNGAIRGEGDTLVDIDGGVGAIEIRTE